MGYRCTSCPNICRSAPLHSSPWRAAKWESFHSLILLTRLASPTLVISCHQWEMCLSSDWCYSASGPLYGCAKHSLPPKHVRWVHLQAAVSVRMCEWHGGDFIRSPINATPQGNRRCKRQEVISSECASWRKGEEPDPGYFWTDNETPKMWRLASQQQISISAGPQNLIWGQNAQTCPTG